MALVPFIDPAESDRANQPIEGEFVAEPQPEQAQEPVKQDEPLSIEFLATLAGVNTAAKPLNFDIDGAAKISLETDETQTPYVIALLALKRHRLIVKVTVDNSVVGTPVVKGKRKSKKSAEPEAD